MKISKKLDWVVYPNSPIANLPRRMQPLALLARNALRLPGKLRRTAYPFEKDGMATIHNVGFLQEPHFQAAYERAVAAMPFDYEIPWRVHQALWAANVASNLPGKPSFVELGTGRGFIMTSVMEYLSFSNTPEDMPSCFLFDSFSPFVTNGIDQQSEEFGLSRYYADSYKAVAENFAEWPNVRLVKCFLPEGLDEVKLSPIGFLHIDLNASQIEIDCLKSLWNDLVPGAIVLLDDYAYRGYESAYLEMNNFAKDLGIRILTTASGQGIIIK